MCIARVCTYKLEQTISFINILLHHAKTCDDDCRICMLIDRLTCSAYSTSRTAAQSAVNYGLLVRNACRHTFQQRQARAEAEILKSKL